MSANCPTCGCTVSEFDIKEGWCDSCGKRLPRNIATLEALKPLVPEVQTRPAPLPLPAPAPEPALRRRAAPTTPMSRRESRVVPPRKKIVPPRPVKQNLIEDQESAMAWGSVRAGLTQATVGQILLAVWAFTVMVMLADEPLLASGAYLHGFTLSLVGFVSVATVSILLMLFGMICVCAVPEESELRRRAVMVPVGFGILMICLVLAVMTQVDAYRVDHGVYSSTPIILRPERPNELHKYIFGETGLLIFRYGALAGWLLQTLCFFLFIQGVGTYFNRRALAIHARIYLIAFGLFLLAGAGFLVILDTRAVEIHLYERVQIRHAAIGVGSFMMLWGGIITMQARRRVDRAV